MRTLLFASPPRNPVIVFGPFPRVFKDAIPQDFPITCIPSDTSLFYCSPKFLLNQFLWFLRLRSWAQAFINACITRVRPKLLFTVKATDIRIHKSASYFPETRFFVVQATLATLTEEIDKTLPRGESQSELVVFGIQDKERLKERGFHFKQIHVWGNWKSILHFRNRLNTPPVSLEFSSVLFYVSVIDHKIARAVCEEGLKKLAFEDLLSNIDYSVPEKEYYKDPYRVALIQRREEFVFRVLLNIRNEHPGIQIITLGRSSDKGSSEIEEIYFRRHLPGSLFVAPFAPERNALIRKIDGVYVSSISNLINDALGAGRRATWIDVAGVMNSSFPPSDWYLRQPSLEQAQSHLLNLLSMTSAHFAQRNARDLARLNRPLSEGELRHHILNLFSTHGLSTSPTT